MPWSVEFCDEFDVEFPLLADAVRIEMLATLRFLQEHGPQAGRPAVDTLNGSDYANMKELRFGADDGVWRVAFAFDPDRKAILLCAGDKSGVNEKRFYKALIAKADARFKRYLEQQAKKKVEQ